MYWTMPLEGVRRAPMGIVNGGAYPLLSYREARRGLDTSECLARPVRSVWGGPRNDGPREQRRVLRQAHSTPSAAVCRRGTPRRTSRQPSHTRSWGTCRGRRPPQGQPGVERGDALQAPPMALRTLLEVGAREPLHQGAGRLQGPRRWRWGVERPTAGSQRLGTTPIAEHPVVAQALEASREDMQQEAPDELGHREDHHLDSIALPVIAPAEMHHVVLDGHETLIADRNPMRIAPEIRHHLLGASKGWLSIDDPVLAPQGVQPRPQRGWRTPAPSRCKGQLPLGEGGVEPVEILPAKDPCEGFDWEEELPPRGNPPVLLGGQGAAGHETMHVEMLVQVCPQVWRTMVAPRSPPSQRGSRPRCAACVPRGLEEEGIEDTGIALG